jgi:hypothetical protein
MSQRIIRFNPRLVTAVPENNENGTGSRGRRAYSQSPSFGAPSHMASSSPLPSRNIVRSLPSAAQAASAVCSAKFYTIERGAPHVYRRGMHL